MKRNKTALFLIYCGIFTALGVILPQFFHFFGAASGQTFLPMHIPVLVSGLAISPSVAAVCGVLSPFLSCIVTSMPSPVKLPFMCIELFVYGVSSGLFMRLFDKRIKNKTAAIYCSLVSAQICGRAVNIICTYFATELFNINNPAVSVRLALLSIPIGFTGLVIQWLFIPPVVKILRLMKIGKAMSE